jgi:hypothetical protein|tara:strand:+ start:116 stop:310 length:195 start_codon:yes stop_codon:yes gene_type:complete
VDFVDPIYVDDSDGWLHVVSSWRNLGKVYGKADKPGKVGQLGKRLDMTNECQADDFIIIYFSIG